MIGYCPCLSLPKSEMRKESLSLAEAFLEEGDIDSVLGLLQVIPAGEENRYTIFDIILSIADYDSELVFREIEKLRQNLTSYEFGNLVAKSSKFLAQEGRHLSALDYVKSADLTDKERSVSHSEIIKSWAKDSPSEVSGFILGLSRGSDYQAELLNPTLPYLDLKNGAVYGLVDDVVRGQKNVSNLSGTISRIIGGDRQISKEEKTSLFSSYDQLFTGKQGEDFAYDTFVSWGSANLEEALTSLNLIEKPSVRKKVVRRLYGQIAEYDPDSAAEWKAWMNAK